MYALNGHPIYFKFKQKYQLHSLFFQTIFPFLMTMTEVCKFSEKFNIKSGIKAALRYLIEII